MPIKKFRDISEMSDTWLEPGSPELARAIHSVWDLARRVCPGHFPPGVYADRVVGHCGLLTNGTQPGCHTVRF